jgi:hypothetical protein
MRFGNFVVVEHNGKIVCGKLGDCGIYLEYMGDANPIPVREVEPLFEIEVRRPFPGYFKVDDFRKFVISTLTDADPVKGPHPAITHCEGCGCDWLDNGLNPVGCPYCKQSADAKILVAERDALEAENERLREVLAAMVSWFPSADTYLRLGFDPKTPMQVLKEAKAVLFKENRDGGR